MSYKWTRDVVRLTAKQERALNGEEIVSARDGYGALVEYYDLLDADKDDVEESLKQFRQELELHGLEEMELTAKQLKEDAIRTATSAIELATIAWQVEDFLKRGETTTYYVDNSPYITVSGEKINGK